MRRLGMLVGTLLVIAGCTVAFWQRSVNIAYAELGRQVLTDSTDIFEGDSDAEQSCGSLDWDALTRQNQDAVAWVEVDGTDISLPVVEARADDRSYYLTHDIWGRPALEGTPFLDHRCGADGTHRLVYGHHLATGGQFSELQRTYEQEVFGRLGTCHWHTPEKGATAMRPLCALRVDMRYGQIQTFDFPDSEGLHRWLSELEGAASARSVDAALLASKAASALTLVTCSSDLAWQPWRTIVVFVETSE